MAREGPNLETSELNIFESNGRQEDIASISRQIGKRLKHRGDKWTTLVPEWQRAQKRSAPTVAYTEFNTRPERSQFAQGMVPTQRPKIVLLGPEGAGKSALGNLLVGEEVFMVAATSESGQQGCETQFTKDDQWEVVDTPGKPFNPTSKGCKSVSKDSLNKIKEKVKEADVIIFVLNTSHKRTPDMGFSAFNQIFPYNLSDTGMLVTTHGNTHYRTKGTAELLADIKESSEISEFLNNISNRVVIVELGDGQQSIFAILEGTAVYGKEREQARQMVMAMVDHIMQKRHAFPETSSHSDP